MMCLDETRETFDIEKALVLSAKARGQALSFHIDEVTCRIQAIYELQ